MSPELIDKLATSAVIDILLSAQESYWLKRAEDFAKVGTVECDEIARACRNKAALCREDESEWSDLLAVELGEVA